MRKGAGRTSAPLCPTPLSITSLALGGPGYIWLHDENACCSCMCTVSVSCWNESTSFQGVVSCVLPSHPRGAMRAKDEHLYAGSKIGRANCPWWLCLLLHGVVCGHEVLSPSFPRCSAAHSQSQVLPFPLLSGALGAVCACHALPRLCCLLGCSSPLREGRASSSVPILGPLSCVQEALQGLGGRCCARWCGAVLHSGQRSGVHD